MGIPRADACMDTGMLQGIRPVTPDHRCLEARFHADEESEEGLQDVPRERKKKLDDARSQLEALLQNDADDDESPPPPIES